MFSKKLDEVVLSQTTIDGVRKYTWKGAWEEKDANVKTFKSEIRSKLQTNQDDRCAYCELLLATRGPEIEHIAPKAKYHAESFNPANLVLACHSCNGSSHKGKRDVVIDATDNDYRKWSFRIVHPYFDDPTSFFDVSESMIVQIKRGLGVVERDKASYTIDLFDLNCSAMIDERKKDRVYTLWKNTPEKDRIFAISAFKGHYE